MIEVPVTGRVTYLLSAPPSTNKLHRSTKDGRRFSTGAYKAWQKAAGGEIMEQRSKMPGPRSIAGHFGFALACHPDDAADIDNRVKPSLDLLQAMGVIQNDRLAVFQVSGASRAVPRLMVRVAVWPIREVEAWQIDL